MKTAKRMLSIVFILVLLVQSTSLAFALSGTEQKSYKADNKKIDQAEVEKLVKEVQEIRAKEGKVSYSKKELANVEQAKKRASIVQEKEKLIQKQIDTFEEKVSIATKNSNVSASFSSGDGSEQNPYTITTPDQLAYIAQDLSACYSLTKDIDMNGVSWTPIGPFTGKFNGDGHKISNLKINSTASTIGLFGTCDGATIENLKLCDADIHGSNYVAAFAGITTNTVLKNLSLESSEISGAGYVGGIVASGSQGTEIYGCSNDGTVKATGEISGGIVATMNGKNLENCLFKGTITGTNYVAGIVGMLQNDATNCTNAGSVSGDNTIGGIAAQASCSEKSVYVFYCYNNGKVSGKSEVAGITAFSASTEDNSNMMSIYFGGNSGDVTATGSYAGGISGDSACNMYISKCYNTGKIYANSIYGGLVGRLNVSTIYDGAFARCYNAGNIMKRDDQNAAKAGSMIGYNCGILVKQNYYLSGYAPPIGKNDSGPYIPKTFGVSASDLKSIQTTFGTPFVADTQWINRGYPIIDGINYVFGTSHKTQYPTIVIPGVIGSELCEGDNKLWFKYGEAFNPEDVLRLELTSTGTSVNNVSVFNDDDFGTTDIYKNLVTSLRQEYGIDEVYFFAYDWRMDNADNANKLSEYIKTVVGSPKVNIVAHSMGGLVASSYIKENSQTINKYISLGTPYLGSPKVPYVFNTGALIKKGPLDVAAFGLKQIASHMTSAYQLLPYDSPETYIAVAEPDKIDPVDYNNEFDFITNKLKMWGTDINDPIPPAVREAFLDKSTTLMESIHTASSSGGEAKSISSSAIEMVDSYAIAGTGQTTIKKTVFDSNGDCIENLNFDFTHGDGTVPEWSASINGLIKTKRYNLEHTELASDSKVIEKVKEMINGAKPEYSYTPPEETKNVVLRVAAEANVSISDGDETLTNIDGHQNSEADFGSMYVVGKNEDILIFALSAEKTYDIKMDSFKSDTIDYDVQFFTKNKLVEERTFNDLSVTDDTNIITDTSRKNTVLSVDKNDNGVIDKTIKPDKIVK